MEALRAIPKVIEGVEEIQGDPYQLLAEYKRNMRTFIESVSKEVEGIIEQYERKLAELREENSRLKGGKGTGELPLRTAVKKEREERDFQSHGFVHSGKRSPNLEMMQTAKSTLFTPFVQGFQDDIKLSAILCKYKRGKDEDSNFPVELINPEPGEDDDFRQGKSQFEIKSNRKKQREEELRNFLETGKKNMNHTTKRFLESIGKNKGRQQEDREGNGQLNRDHSDSSLSLKKNDTSALNQSLGNICNSLDNSFVSKRARSNKRKKSSQIEEEIRRKQKQEEEMTKMMKSKGIKNLLSRLRQNVEASPKKELEIIKSSKLISCGPSPSNEIPLPTSRKNSSKVMINPVPVDIVRKSMVSKKDRSPSPQPFSPTKKPQSILKQSSIMAKETSSPTKSILKQTSTVLSKSISGISAIEFAD